MLKRACRRVCRECGKEFVTTCWNKLTCSPECIYAHNTREMRERAAAEREKWRADHPTIPLPQVDAVVLEYRKQKAALVEIRKMAKTKRSFCPSDLQRCPANKLPSVVNGIIDGRNTLTGVRR